MTVHAASHTSEHPGDLGPDAPKCVEAAFSHRRDALQNRGRILQAASELFRRDGVDSVSMHQIALAAGIGQGTLYRNFEHKGELCSALAADAITSLQSKLQNDLSRTDVSPLALLDGVVESFVDFSEEFLPVICGMADAACGDRRMELYQTPLYRWMHDTVAGLLSRAIAAGEISTPDVPYCADALLALLDINLRQYQRTERGFPRERILNGMRSFIFHGLGVASPHTVPVPVESA